MRMWKARSSKTAVSYHITTRHRYPVDLDLAFHRRETSELTNVFYFMLRKNVTSKTLEKFTKTRT